MKRFQDAGGNLEDFLSEKVPKYEKSFSEVNLIRNKLFYRMNLLPNVDKNFAR